MASVDAESVKLTVWAFNGVAQRFFERVGFTPMFHRMAAKLR